MLEGLIKKIFGDPNEKELKNIRPIVDKINALEPDMERMSDANLQAKTSEFKLRLQKSSGSVCGGAGSVQARDRHAAF